MVNVEKLNQDIEDFGVVVKKAKEIPDILVEVQKCADVNERLMDDLRVIQTEQSKIPENMKAFTEKNNNALREVLESLSANEEAVKMLLKEVKENERSLEERINAIRNSVMDSHELLKESAGELKFSIKESSNMVIANSNHNFSAVESQMTHVQEELMDFKEQQKEAYQKISMENAALQKELKLVKIVSIGALIGIIICLVLLLLR